MIITRTPYRISFFGGSTDYKPWYEQHGGAVLTATIDKYCHVLARYMPPFLGSKYLVFWSQMEKVNTRDEIQHRGVRGCLEYLGIFEGLEVNHAGDLPARSGLGSSSCFTVGMLNALHALRGETVSHARLAQEAIAVEQDVLKETVGIQDQIECAHGGLNYIQIDRDGSYGLFPLSLNDDRLNELQSHLMLFFTGTIRYATDIAKSHIENIGHKDDAMFRMQRMAADGFDILTKPGPIELFGELLDEAWTLKRSLSPLISNAGIDDAYACARAAGAIGGKILGAGGGGFMLLFAPPCRHAHIRAALTPMIDVPVRFEWHGSQVIHAS